MKRLMSFLLCVSLLLSMAVPAMAQENVSSQLQEPELQTQVPEESAPALEENDVTQEQTIETVVTEAVLTGQSYDTAVTAGQCGDDMTWSFDADTQTLTISGTGAMDPIVSAWDGFRNGVFIYEPQWWSLPVRHVVVEEGVEYLTDYAFSCPDLETVKLPTTLKAIPEYGFIISSAMTSVKLPEGIKTITGWPFGEPKTSSLGLTDLYLPASLEEIDIVTIYVSGLQTLKNIHFAGTRAQWNALERIRSASMTELMPSTDAEYAQLEQIFNTINVICADDESGGDDDDFVIPFDELLFVASVESICAEAVTYYVDEEPVYPVITVYYKDQTNGALPGNIRIAYPEQWPAEPGTYTLEALVANKYHVPFQVTVLPVEQAGPTEKLDAPIVELGKDMADQDVLLWTPVEYAASYEIYRATSKTGKYSLVDTTQDFFWMNETVPVGKTYYYKVVAVYEKDTSLNSAQSNAVAFTGRCAQPVLSMGFDQSTGKPKFSWNKVSGAQKYEIWRSADGKKFSKLTTTTKTSYTDTKATAGNWYLYRVVAVASKTAYNSEPSYAVEQLCYLSRPTLTASVDAATGKPSLSWKKISGAASYRVYKLVGEEYQELTQQKTLTYLDHDVVPGCSYTYVIVAFGSGADTHSYMSAEKTVTATCARPVLKTDITDSGKPVIIWEPVDGAVHYQVLRSTKSGSGYKEILVTADTTYTDASVAAGKTYYYKVVAVGENCKSAQSSYAKATGKCDIPALTVQAGSTGKPVLTWNKIAGAKKYEIWRSVDGAAFKKLTTTTKTTYTDSKATEGAECTYKVKALGSKSSYNGLLSEELGCYVTCAAPSLTAKVDTATGKPSLSWKKVTGAIEYAIYRAEDGTTAELLTTVTGISHLDTTAETDHKYAYYVVAVGKDTMFDSLESAVKTVTVTPGQPKLSGTVNETGKAVITWQAVEDALEYEVYRSTSSSKSYKLVDTVTELTYTDTGITAGKTYYYKVVAVGVNTKSAQSGYVKLTGKCAQPVAEATLNVKSGKPVITWEKITGAKKYEIYRATSESGKYSKIGTSTKTSYTDSKASVGTTYYYKVVAAGSKSSYNSIQSAATEPVTVLLAQPTVTVKNDSKTGDPVISWKKVTGATKYIVMYVDVTDFMESETGPDEAYVLEHMQNVTTTKTSVTLTDTEIGHAYLVMVTAVPKNEEFFSVPTEPQYVVAACATPKITGFIDEYYGKPGAYWDDVEGAEYYFVYRSTKSGSGYKYLGYVEGSDFVDTSAVKGKTYYYKVTAVTEYTESAMSNYVKLKSK